MLLYHGTNSTNLEVILTEGIKPRGSTNKGNWQEGNISMPFCTYLSDSLAPYFAAWCQKDLEGTKGLILEVDTDCLVPSFLLPDEDVLRIVLSRQNRLDEIPSKRAFKQWRNLMLLNQSFWEASLKIIGTCAYMGTIPVRAITRYVLFERDFEHIMRYDNSVSPTAHSLLGARHREFLRFLFDGENFNADFLNSFILNERNEILMPESPEWHAAQAKELKRMLKHRAATVEVYDV